VGGLGFFDPARSRWGIEPSPEDMGQTFAVWGWDPSSYFVLPYFRDRLHAVGSADELIARNDLHSIADALRSNPKLRLFANRNDFLTSAADVDWISALLGPERVHTFPTGGHLGNLDQPAVQKEIMDSLEDLLPAPAAPPGG